jgi:hypothetical protein
MAKSKEQPRTIHSSVLFSFANRVLEILSLTLLSQFEEPPMETPLARRPSGKTSEMMIHATGPQLGVKSVKSLRKWENP